MKIKHLAFWISFIPCTIIQVIMGIVSNSIEYFCTKVEDFLGWWEGYCFDYTRHSQHVGAGIWMNKYEIKIFEYADVEWYAGRNKEEVAHFIVKCIEDLYTIDEILGDLVQISEENMDCFTYFDEDAYTTDEHPTKPKHTKTFREQLVIEMADGKPFPRFFASTEF